MSAPEDVLAIARVCLGTTEMPAGSNRQMFGDWYGWNGVPWCAIFVSYCFYRGKAPLAVMNYGTGVVNPKGFAYCPYGVRWFKEANRLYSTGQVGDVVFFDWDSDGIADHVGIVETIAGSKLTTIEGNTSYGSDSNGGEVMRRLRSTSIICGFGRPEYDGRPAPIPPSGAPTWPGRLIKLASPLLRGEDIRLWQQRMLELLYDLGPAGADGVFGERSLAALLKLQADRKLVVDGVIGSITWAATWT